MRFRLRSVVDLGLMRLTVFVRCLLFVSVSGLLRMSGCCRVNVLSGLVLTLLIRLVRYRNGWEVSDECCDYCGGIL